MNFNLILPQLRFGQILIRHNPLALFISQVNQYECDGLYHFKEYMINGSIEDIYIVGPLKAEEFSYPLYTFSIPRDAKNKGTFKVGDFWTYSNDGDRVLVVVIPSSDPTRISFSSNTYVNPCLAEAFSTRMKPFQLMERNSNASAALKNYLNSILVMAAKESNITTEEILEVWNQAQTEEVIGNEED
jgi:hypothetical protein